MGVVSNCSLVAWLFFGSVGAMVIGNVLGLIAWRGANATDQSRWRWLVDPLYLFRPSAYQGRGRLTRLVALGFLVFGAMLLITLVGNLIQAQTSGATGVCGYTF